MPWRRPLLILVTILALGFHGSQAVSAALPAGKADFVFIDQQGNPDKPIQVWTYRPKSFGPESPIVFVMHGTLRNGETYREPWIPIAEEQGCLIVVPEFSTKHYPGSSTYHFGNILTPDGKPVEEAKWTFSAIEHLFDHIKQETGSKRERYYLFGHSAGGQFVHRMVLCKPSLRVALAVAANAGSYTMPSTQVKFPYGLERSGIDETRLRQALTTPLVVLLGDKDTDPNDRNLPRDPAAQAQGSHRFERGHNFFKAATAEAERLQVGLKWTREIVPGVGHDNALMAPAAARLFQASEATRSRSLKLQAAFEQVDRHIAAEMSRDPVAGCTVGIVVGPDLVWSRSYGFADHGLKTPSSNDLVYRVGSITKQFTGLMLLQLVERGKVRLSDPVRKYFPEVERIKSSFPDAPPITLCQLATMTSGLAREPAHSDIHSTGPASDWEKKMLAALEETRFQHEPDTHYLYSNIGYAVLGAALARVANQPFETYVTEQILQPLGMTSTVFVPDDTIRKRLARGYLMLLGKPNHDTPEAEHIGRGYRTPNGALYSTVNDLARFLAFELGYGPESVLKRSSLEANFSRVNSANGDLTMGYGVGFSVRRQGERIFVGHSGSVAGYTAAAFVDRKTKTGVIVLRNQSAGRPDPTSLCLRALEIVSGSVATPTPMAQKTRATSLPLGQ